MTEIEQLTRLAELETMKAADKAELVPLLEKYGVEKPTKKSCPNCWRDAAIMALREAKKGEQPNEPKMGLPRLRGDAGTVGVYWKGRYVNNDVMDAELADWLKETNFPETLYEK